MEEFIKDENIVFEHENSKIAIPNHDRICATTPLSDERNVISDDTAALAATEKPIRACYSGARPPQPGLVRPRPPASQCRSLLRASAMYLPVPYRRGSDAFTAASHLVATGTASPPPSSPPTLMTVPRYPLPNFPENSWATGELAVCGFMGGAVP